MAVAVGIAARAATYSVAVAVLAFALWHGANGWRDYLRNQPEVERARAVRELAGAAAECFKAVRRLSCWEPVREEWP